MNDLPERDQSERDQSERKLPDDESPPRRPSVLGVGNCGFDHGSLQQLLKAHCGAELTPADSHSEALEAVRRESFDLVLVNRVLDRTGESGVELIQALKSDAAGAAVPIMLISNYSDAQREAESRGALPGFGKSTLNSPATLERLQAALRAKA